MRIIEIIHLRTAGAALEGLCDILTKSIGAESEPIQITLLRRVGLDSDLAIHIRHPAGPRTKKSSEIGPRLASALEAYGLVEHTLWEEVA